MKIYSLTTIIVLLLHFAWSKPVTYDRYEMGFLEAGGPFKNRQNKSTSYHFATEKMSFERAESYCKGKKMQLVKINDKETNKLVYDWANRHNFGNYWINGNDKESEGVFVDSDKKRLTYFNWNSGEPNNNDNSENCIQMYIDNDGHWNDCYCGLPLNVICEPMEIESKSDIPGKDEQAALTKKEIDDDDKNMRKELIGYLFSSGKMTFESALSFCRMYMMQLVKVEDKKTNQMLYRWAKRNKFGHFWIDGNDKESEGVFVDSNRKRLTYTNWHRKQPDNYKNEEHCVHMITDKNGLWNDVSCDDLLKVICQPTTSLPKIPNHDKPDIPDNEELDDPTNRKKIDEANTSSRNESTRYHFATKRMPFDSAISYCRGKQMRLVKIKDKETDVLVNDWAKQLNFSVYWINGNDKESKGVFVDSDKKRLNYTNWHPNKPYLNRHGKHCVQAYSENSVYWDVSWCFSRLHVICQPMESERTRYHFATEKMSFESAVSYCRVKQMQLVKIKDKKTNLLVHDWAKRIGFGNYWVNGNDKESEGVFVDSDNKRLNYTNWDYKEPNNFKNAEHCIQVYIFTNGIWNDFPCTVPLNVICEPMEILEYFGSLAKTLSDMSKSIIEKSKEYFG